MRRVVRKRVEEWTLKEKEKESDIDDEGLSMLLTAAFLMTRLT